MAKSKGGDSKSKSVQAGSEKELAARMEIAKINKRIADYIREAASLNKQSADYDKKKIAIETEKQRLADARSKIEREILGTTKQQIKLEDQLIANIEKRAEVSGEVRSLSEDIAKSLISQKASLSVASELGKAMTHDFSALQKTTGLMATALDDIADDIAGGVEVSGQFLKTIRETVSEQEEFSDLTKQMANSAADIAKGEYKSLDLTKQMVINEKKRLEIEEKEKKLSEQWDKLSEKDKKRLEYEIKKEKELLENHTLQLDYLKKSNDAAQKMSDKTQKILGISDKIVNLDFKGAITNYFNLDSISKDFKDKLGGAIAGVVRSVTGKGGFVEGMKEAGKNLGGLVKMAPRLIGGLALGGLIAGVSFLAKSFLEMDEEIANIGKEFGMSYKEAGHLHGETAKLATQMNIVGINSKEVLEGVKAASEAFEGIDIASQLQAGNKEIEGFVKQATVLSQQFGLSGQEIGAIKDISTLTGKSMDTLVKESVDLGKGTFNAKQSLKILSGIPPVIASQFKGSTRELIAAAQKAKMLGMELSKIKDIGRGTLDIEESLKNEMEARVMTGRDINLDKAREYALHGDVFNLQEEILKQAGSLKDFQKMNVLQQESMAKAMGMSVEEMTKMLTNAEKLKKANINADYAQRLSQMEKASDLEAEAAKARTQEQKDYILSLANEKRSASIKERMKDIMEKIKQKFAPIVEKISEMVQGLFSAGKGASGIDSIIQKIDVEKLAEGIKEAIPKIIEFVKNLIQNLPQIIKFVTGLVNKFSSMGGILGGTLPMLGLMALKIGGPKGIAGAFSVAGKAAKGTYGLIKGMATKSKEAAEAASKLSKGAGGAGKALSKAGKSAGKGGGGKSPIADFVNQIKPANLLAVGAAMVLFAAAVFILAEAFIEFGKVDWAKAWPGILVMGALMLAAVAMGAIAATLGPAIIGPLLAIGAAMLLFSASVLVIAVAFDVLSKVNWTNVWPAVPLILGLGAAAALLGLMAGPIIAGSAALMILGVAAAVFSAGLMVFASAMETLSKVDMAKAGKGLADGLMAIAGAVANISISDIIWSFLKLNLALTLLPLDAIKAMGELGKSSLKDAGANLVAGVNSLIGINTQIDFGKIEDTFDDLEDALDELDLDDIKAFGELANEGIAKVGDNLAKGINSLSTIDVGAAIKVLNPLEDLFDSLEDALDELDYDDLGKFVQIDWSKFASSADGIVKFLTGIQGATAAGTDGLWSFIKAISSVKSDAISSLANGINTLGEAFKNLSSALQGISVGTAFFQSLATVDKSIASISYNLTKLNEQAYNAKFNLANVTGGNKTTSVNASDSAPGKSPMSNVEQKLDTLINLFGQAASQPTVIKFGEKFVEQITTQYNFKKSYSAGTDNSYGRSPQF